MMTAKQERRELLGSERISKLIPMMAVPTIVSQLITTIYNLVDTFFVSKLGTNATAAVGVNNSMERFIMMFATLIGAGACSYIARLLGQNKDDQANRVMSTSIISGLTIGLVVAVLGKIFLSPLTDLLGATADCKQYAMEYGTYVLYAAPFMIGSLILNMVLRSEGSSRFAMIGMGFGGILNCFLDPLFIFTFDLGVSGASIATAISKIISFLILLWPYIRKKTFVSLSVKYFKLVYEDIKEVIEIGMASFMRSVFNVIALVYLNRVAGSFSTSALAAISVATRIMQFPFAAILGFGQGFQPVVGYNWGAKYYKRVKDSYHFTVTVGIIGSIILSVIIITFAHPLIALFNSQADLEIFRYGCLAMRAEAIMLPLHILGTICNMFYAGIGKGKQALLISTARQGYCFLPLLFILPRFFDVTGLCITQSAADLLSGIITIPLHISANKLIATKLPEDQKIQSM